MVRDVEKWGWVLFVATYLVGDVVTTAVGLSHPRVAEANPVLGPLVGDAPHNHVVYYILVLKLGVALTLYAVVEMVPRRYRHYPPYLLGVIGVLTTVNNLFVIARA